MEDRKFILSLEWGFDDDEKPYTNCILAPIINELDEEYDGWNWVGRYGDEGAVIVIYSNLKEAILKAGYNPFYIDYKGLSEEETKFKDELLKKITWDKMTGVVFIKE